VCTGNHVKTHTQFTPVNAFPQASRYNSPSMITKHTILAKDVSESILTRAAEGVQNVVTCRAILTRMAEAFVDF